jgi:hypothetical protein
MAKYRQYNYAQTIMVPVNLEDQLVPVGCPEQFHIYKNNSVWHDTLDRDVLTNKVNTA